MRNTAAILIVEKSLLSLTADPNNYQVMDYRSGDFTRCLMISTRAALSQEQIFALFDIIPGMEYCELQRDAYGMSKGQWLHIDWTEGQIYYSTSLTENLLTCIVKLLCCFAPLGHALIRYNNLGSALYAKEKLNGFEYPPGNRLVVNFVDDGEDRCRYQTYTTSCLYSIDLWSQAMEV